MRILHIEDQAAMAEQVDFFLKESRWVGPSSEIVNATSLTQGIEYARLENWDCAILDLNLPDSTGLDTLKKFIGCCSHLPIVVMSGIDSTEIADQCLALGAQDFTAKTEMMVLGRVCRYAIERWKYQQEQIKSTAEIRHLNDLYQSILDISPELIVRFTPHHEITYVNKKVSEVLDLGFKDIVGKCLVDFLDVHSGHMEAILGCLSPDNTTSSVHEEKVGDRYIAWVYVAIFDVCNVLTEYQAVGRDVTYRYLSDKEILIAISDKMDFHNAKISRKVRSTMNLVQEVNSRLDEIKGAL